MRNFLSFIYVQALYVDLPGVNPIKLYKTQNIVEWLIWIKRDCLVLRKILTSSYICITIALTYRSKIMGKNP